MLSKNGFATWFCRWCNCPCVTRPNKSLSHYLLFRQMFFRLKKETTLWQIWGLPQKTATPGFSSFVLIAHSLTLDISDTRLLVFVSISQNLVLAWIGKFATLRDWSVEHYSGLYIPYVYICIHIMGRRMDRVVKPIRRRHRMKESPRSISFCTYKLFKFMTVSRC